MNELVLVLVFRLLSRICEDSTNSTSIRHRMQFCEKIIFTKCKVPTVVSQVLNTKFRSPHIQSESEEPNVQYSISLEFLVNKYSEFATPVKDIPQLENKD
jgi:hypothetical protein